VEGREGHRSPAMAGGPPPRGEILGIKTGCT
jgi:hypothetical protein